jgi:SAM-dependent methyltransferase
MIKHLEVASHTNPQKEKFFYDSRIKYFVWIIERFLGPPGAGKQKVLDFGTSFGHMTSLLTKRGYEVTGVEINPVMRATASRNAPDARIIKDLEDLSDESGSFDIVLALDSLYFATLPSKTISDLSRLLKPRGKIIMRNTNRIWFYKIKRLKGRIMKRSPLGDARFAFSVKGLVTCLLKNGMNSIQVHYLERGKENSQLEKCLYFLSGAIAELTRGRLACCPGTIIEARKATT